MLLYRSRSLVSVARSCLGYTQIYSFIWMHCRDQVLLIGYLPCPLTPAFHSCLLILNFDWMLFSYVNATPPMRPFLCMPLLGVLNQLNRRYAKVLDNTVSCPLVRIMSLGTHYVPWSALYPMVRIMSLGPHCVPWSALCRLVRIMSLRTHYVLWSASCPLVRIMSIGPVYVPWSAYAFSTRDLQVKT